MNPDMLPSEAALFIGSLPVVLAALHLTMSFLAEAYMLTRVVQERVLPAGAGFWKALRWLSRELWRESCRAPASGQFRRDGLELAFGCVVAFSVCTMAVVRAPANPEAARAAGFAPLAMWAALVLGANVYARSRLCECARSLRAFIETPDFQERARDSQARVRALGEIAVIEQESQKVPSSKKGTLRL